MGRLFRNAKTAPASKLRISGISATSTSPHFGRESGDQVLDRNTRQLARLVARQGFDETKGPGKESRVDTSAQGSHDGFASESRSDDESRQSRYRPVVFLRHDESTVPYAFDGIEMKVEMRERSPLSRDVDEIGGPPVQQEGVSTAQLDHIGEQDFPPHVAPYPSPLLVGMQAHAGQGAPLLGLGWAAGRDLTGLGAAVDLVKRRREARLGFDRQLGRKRRSGAKQEVHRGQLARFGEQHPQVNRRGDQAAWPRQGLELGTDVRGGERPAP